MPTLRIRPVLSPILPLAIALSLLTIGCASEADDEPRYRATIRRTSHDIPHILAEDYGSLGFGQGYAFAEDHACALAEQVVKIRGERARWHGRGEGDANVNSDFAYRHLGVRQAAEADFEAQPEDIKALMRGYVAGYNAFLASGAALPGGCDGEPWVGPISEFDHFAYIIDLGLLASGRQLLDYIATAAPPGQAQVAPPLPLGRINAYKRSGFGSNGWGLGADLVQDGTGMLLANPHFPWEGELRLWENHLTIPGELDVYGVALLGTPGVLIGFNDAVAWTPTVSAGQRFTMYALTLDANDPTRYVYDGEVRDMTSTQHTIQVKDARGELVDETRRLWRSHHGPILNIDPIGWSDSLVLTYRDANLGNRTLVSQFVGMNRARDMDEFQAAHRDNLGIPWVNTMSTSREGRAWYIDSTPTPRLSQAAIDAWLDGITNGDFLVSFFHQNADVTLLDGSTSRDEWVAAEGAREPGLVPWSELPQLERSDFIFNANDSHWLTNPAAPLEGYSPMHGFERTARTVRTRMNATLLTEGAAGHAGADGRFSLDELGSAALANRSLSAELVLDALVARCTDAEPVDVGAGELVDIGAACAALAGWDGRYDLDSVGAVVFREWLGDFQYSELFAEGAVFAADFDPADPIGTPRALANTLSASGVDRQLLALARAVRRLDDAGLAVDVPLRDAQFTKKGDVRVPIHGGGRMEGITNLIVYDPFKSTLGPDMPRGEVVNDATDLTTEGYVVNFGTSFLMTLLFTADGPSARALLTYSQGSSKPESPYFSDQTGRFSAKAWRDCLFRDEQIAADPELRTYAVSAPRPPSP